MSREDGNAPRRQLHGDMSGQRQGDISGVPQGAMSAQRQVYMSGVLQEQEQWHMSRVLYLDMYGQRQAALMRDGGREEARNRWNGRDHTNGSHS